MLIKAATATVKSVSNCHHGQGTLACRELLAEYRRPGPGIRYIHDDVLEPGCVIGDHQHDGDEEVYLVVSGQGAITIDGVTSPIGPGDCCLTRSGHRHAIANTGTEPLRLIVVNVGIGEA